MAVLRGVVMEETLLLALERVYIRARGEGEGLFFFCDEGRAVFHITNLLILAIVAYPELFSL